VKDAEKCIISLKLYPNRELEQQIFSFGPDVEVLAPEWFRIQIIEKISENVKKYFPMQKLCIANNELCIVK
jgi:predicted DNA-binding transcriptional regulator YafY